MGIAKDVLDGLPALEEVPEGIERLLYKGSSYTEVIGAEIQGKLIPKDQITARQFPGLLPNVAYAIARIFRPDTILITVVANKPVKTVEHMGRSIVSYFPQETVYRPTHEATYRWKERLFPDYPNSLP